MNIILRIYNRLNENQKRNISHILRRTLVGRLPIYKKLKFQGVFNALLPNGQKFKMYHYGGEIENETFWKGAFKTWESDNGWIWMELCEISEIIFDIGANTGIYGLSAKTVNSKANVVCFEPSIKTYEKLKKNIFLNSFEITAEKIAISNKCGNQIFYDFPWQNQTGASLSERKVKSVKNQVIQYEVKTETLSSYIKRNQIKKLDLLKLDIEMHEAEAIEGFGEFLHLFKPVIIIEVLDPEVANKLNTLIDLKDFNLYHLGLNKTVVKMDKFKVYPNSLSNGDWNYLVFHKSLDSKIKEKTSLYNNIIQK